MLNYFKEAQDLFLKDWLFSVIIFTGMQKKSMDGIKSKIKQSQINDKTSFQPR